MKKRIATSFFLSLILIAAPFWITGCGASSTATPPRALAPGYLNSADQTMGEVLAGARAFYTSIQQQSVAGTMVLSATDKTGFNTFGISLNAAQTLYLAYHGSPTAANQTAAQNAVNQVEAQQSALPL